MNTLVCNFFGGPGAGKSVHAAYSFYRLKKDGFIAELITEYAKDLVYENSIEFLNKYPQKVFAEQRHRIDRVYGKVEMCIVDSPMLMPIFYHENLDQDYVLSEFNRYNNYNIFVQREGTFETEGRIHSVEESKVVDKLILDFFERNKIPYIIVNQKDEFASYANIVSAQ